LQLPGNVVAWKLGRRKSVAAAVSAMQSARDRLWLHLLPAGCNRARAPLHGWPKVQYISVDSVFDQFVCSLSGRAAKLIRPAHNFQ
jgi:hypothetical protein